MKAFLSLGLVALCLLALPTYEADACGGSGRMGMMSGGCSSGSCGMSSMGMHASMGMRSMQTTTMMAGYNSGAGRMGFLAKMRARKAGRMMASAPAVTTTTVVSEQVPEVRTVRVVRQNVIVIPAEEFQRRFGVKSDCQEKQQKKAPEGIRLSPSVAPNTRFVSLQSEPDDALTFEVDF